ncbi:MAG TPA: response regulator, partial [Kofleriaceae bacterium]|nr:response regulator [Kofleriaceae bacterium]
IEDSEDDAEVLLDEVRRGYQVVHDRVSDEAGMREALDRRAFDVILCDHNLPQFDSPAALSVLKDRGLEVPLIIVSGRIGESQVVQLMKRGASDYVHKDELDELLPAIERALTEARVASERRRAHEGLELLAGLSECLTSSLDLEVTLRQTARLVVEGGMADACIVDFFGDGDEPGMSGIAHVSARAETAMRARRFQARPTRDTHPVFSITGWGRPQLVTAIGPEVLEALALDPADPGEAPSASALFIPLAGRTGVIGTIGMARTAARPVFDEVDVRIASELARRTAAALENASLFRQAERARASAEAANRVKDEFLAIATHELRTPMTSILGYTRLLLSGALPEERRDTALEIIDRNTSLQAKLLDDLVDFTRVTSGKLHLDVAPVQLAHVAEIALETIRPAADARGVQLESAIEDDQLTSLGDAGRLQQVVANLLSNAVKFTPAGGRVSLQLHRRGGHIELRVIDTGEGIAPSFLPFVFDRFRQGDTGPSRAHGGLGLGLAIVKHLVELHGGEVEVHSEGPGQGSTFVVRLPVAAPRGEGKPRRARTPTQPRGRMFVHPPELEGLRVLVVDDDEGARRLLDGILGPCQVDVVVASSVAEAIQAFGREPPDILVSDISMPGETGCDLIRRVRELPPERGGLVPAVALSAYARVEDRDAALDAGFNCFLTKPIDPQEFVGVLTRVASTGDGGRDCA